MDAYISDTDGENFDSSFTFDPSGLQPGFHIMNVISFSFPDPLRGYYDFEVISTQELERTRHSRIPSAPLIIPGARASGIACAIHVFPEILHDKFILIFHYLRAV